MKTSDGTQRMYDAFDTMDKQALAHHARQLKAANALLTTWLLNAWGLICGLIAGLVVAVAVIVWVVGR